MPKAKTYYMMLKPVVLPYVKHYRDDFLVHDRRQFRRLGSKESFLLAMRPAGTDFTNLDSWWDDLTGEELVEQITGRKIWCLTYNKRFLHGHDGRVEEISKDAAEALLDGVLAQRQREERQRQARIEAQWPLDYGQQTGAIR